MISYNVRAQKLIEGSDWSHNNLLRKSSLIHCLTAYEWKMKDGEIPLIYLFKPITLRAQIF